MGSSVGNYLRDVALGSQAGRSDEARLDANTPSPSLKVDDVPQLKAPEVDGSPQADVAPLERLPSVRTNS